MESPGQIWGQVIGLGKIAFINFFLHFLELGVSFPSTFSFVWSQLEEEGEEALATHQVNGDSGARGIWEQPETVGRTLFLVHLPFKMSLGPEEICDNGIEEITATVSCSNGLSDERFKGGTRRRQ